MTSIIDKDNVYTNFKHFVVDTRSFQIEKARNVEMYDKLRIYIQKQNEKRQQGKFIDYSTCFLCSNSTIKSSNFFDVLNNRNGNEC